MSANDRHPFLRLRRAHHLTRDRVDALPWPHPRPARDPRLVWLHIAFIWTSVSQIIFGPPPSTVQGVSFSYTATVFFSVLMIISALLVLYAAFCKSQYESFGFEMGGTVGFSGVFLIWAIAAIAGISDWWSTNVGALAVCLAVGNTIRAVRLIRRLW